MMVEKRNPVQSDVVLDWSARNDWTVYIMVRVRTKGAFWNDGG